MLDLFGTLALGTILATSGQAPSVSIKAYSGDLASQKFVTLTGRLQPVKTQGGLSQWNCSLRSEDGRKVRVSFAATSRRAGDRERWVYRVANREKGLTVCEVEFPKVDGVKIGGSYDGDQVIWPSLYRGAMLDDIRTRKSFEIQAKEACKDVPYLYGLYQGDLCLPYFVHQGKEGLFGMMVLDPTHEVVKLTGRWAEAGISYAVSTFPRVPAGKSWKFGEIEVFRSPGKDWHTAADRYRAWLTAQGFGGDSPRHIEPATLQYGRWDDMRTDDVIRWAKAFGINDVLLWVVLYGRGDQYYPCYFPNRNTTGYEGMKRELGRMQAEGLNPYFYTNGYLLSPLQTRKDVNEWHAKFPDQYTAQVSAGDIGYVDEAAMFRAEGHDFAGDWLQTPGGVDPLRVRRVSFQWGEYPLYFWHERPFWAACVNSAEWRKMFRDTARMHAELGAKGIYIDQPGAIQPEICSARGHGHDDDSFGLWNRAYLELMKEVKEAGSRVAPGFFIEIEGSSDLYGKYSDKSLGNFGLDETPRHFSRMLRYTAPWLTANYGMPSLTDGTAMVEHVEHTFSLGGVFRVLVPHETDNSLLDTEASKLLRSAIAVRRKLIPFIDRGRFMDSQNVQTRCCEATWFDSAAGYLAVVRAMEAGASVSLPSAWKPGTAKQIDWRTGLSQDLPVRRVGGRLEVSGLIQGFHLVIITRGE